jgi:glucose/arabinose dehydrogenase
MVKRKGTDRSETLNGSGDADTLLGFGGSDVMKGREGADIVSGGDGSDKIFGGDGDDVIYGHGKADQHASSGYIKAEKITDIGYGAVQTALAPGDDGFLYALSKDSGEIYRIDMETGDKTTFLDVPDGQIGEGGERGVLGMAFHPDYAENGRFFVYMTNADGNIEVREYTKGDGSPPTATFTQTVITIPHQTYNNHNGGSIAFGPDGYLYIGTGDGGSGGDPDHNAQNTDSLLGKILRLDVDSDGFPGNDNKNYAIPDDNPFVDGAGADEIWALGVRNPWRFSFDPETGDLYIGDVGQDSKEEIDFVPAGTAGGLNFGWNYREGDQHYDGTPPDGLTFTDPVFVYSHKSASASVTGGVVNHGPGKGLDGAYMFSDFMTGKFYTLRMVDGEMEDATERSAQLRGDELGQVVAYGVDGDGNVLAVSLNGGIYRLHFGAASGDGNDELHGGDGNDRLYGGVGRDRLSGDAGRDRLDGGIGNDHLRGGADADVFVFQSGMGKDVVVDFDAGKGSHDRLDLGGIKAIADYQDLRANHLTADGNDVVISAGSDRITLEHVKLSDLDRGDFDF